MNKETLKEIHQSLSDEQEKELVAYRGGCSCHISPPCHAHSEPLTEEEAEYLGLLPSIPDEL